MPGWHGGHGAAGVHTGRCCRPHVPPPLGGGMPSRCAAQHCTAHAPAPPPAAPLPPGIINETEAAAVMGHIEPHDYPESLCTYQEMATAAGFAGAQCLHTDAREFGRLVLLSKPE